MKHKHLSLLDVFGEPTTQEPNPHAAIEAKKAEETADFPRAEAELYRTQAAINSRFGMRTMDTSYEFLVSFSE